MRKKASIEKRPARGALRKTAKGPTAAEGQQPGPTVFAATLAERQEAGFFQREPESQAVEKVQQAQGPEPTGAKAWRMFLSRTQKHRFVEIALRNGMALGRALKKHMQERGILKRAGSWFKTRAALPKQLRLAETVSLGEKRFVAIIHVEGRKFLIGGGSAGVSLLTQLDGTV